MSTISFGFVISQLTQLNITTETPLLKPIVRIWAREDYQDELKVKSIIDTSVIFVHSSILYQGCIRKSRKSTDISPELLG